MSIKIGDSVVVKPGVKDEEFNIDIGGYQGRVVEIKKGLVLVDWDSITLKGMKEEVIKKCEERGESWNQFYVEIENVELTTPRDKQSDVDKIVKELSNKYAWCYLGEEGKIIQEVLKDIDPEDKVEAFETWADYLEENLTFPFDAIVDEIQERSNFRVGDKLKVLGISEDIDDLYGVLVDVKHKRGHFVFQLADLEVIDKNLKEYKYVKAYVVWFANR